jgi:hypothetical protein
VRVDIAQITPSTPTTAIEHHSADVLVGVVLDGRQEWWRRRICAFALSGRVPAASVPALLDLVRDSRVIIEVRVALLEILPPSEELLTWLRTTDDDGLGLAILRTRARFHDVTAVPELVRLMESEWHHRRIVAEQGIDMLGQRVVLDVLGFDSALSLMLFGPTPEARVLGVRWADPDITQALADEERMVAREAYDRLADVTDNHGELVRMVADRAPGHLWALAVLAARGDLIDDQWDALGTPRVDVPGLPEDVRAAIVRQYVPGARDTDPRWMLEAACLPDREPEDVLTDAVAALAPYRPASPVTAGDHHQQGEGTYHVVGTTAGNVLVSTLGRFYWSENIPELPGFRRVDDALGAIEVSGLPVFFFGDRAPLTVHDLLFYWQD